MTRPDPEEVGQTPEGQPYLRPRSMPSNERLRMVSYGLATFELVHHPNATITEYAAIEQWWVRIAERTELPIAPALVEEVQRRTHKFIERYRSGSLRKPTKSPERYALEALYHDLAHGDIVFRDGLLHRGTAR